MPYNLCAENQQERQDTLAYFRKAIDGCAAMEIPRMLVVADHPGYTVRRRAAWRQFVENLHILGSYGAQRGVRLVIEPLTSMERPVITTADDCADALEAVSYTHLSHDNDGVQLVVLQGAANLSGAFLTNYREFLGSCLRRQLIFRINIFRCRESLSVVQSNSSAVPPVSYTHLGAGRAGAAAKRSRLCLYPCGGPRRMRASRRSGK